jgi:hypothetical protein
VADVISLGVDIGKRRDHPAMVRADDALRPGLIDINADRLPLGVSYPKLASGIVVAAEGADVLVLDAGGVGRAVLDSVRERRPDAWGLTITGGSKARIEWEEREAFVGKAPLVAHVQAALFHGKLRASEGLLPEELRAFVQRGGKLEAGSGHDDLVMALALALMGLKLERRESVNVSG